MSNPALHSPVDTSRREFLKTSTLAALGTGVLESLGNFSGAYAGGDDTIKIGLIGCGGRGSGAAAQALSTKGNVKLVAMGDAFPDRMAASLNSLKKEHPDRVAVTDETKFVGFDAYQKVLAAGVDLVILATPPGFRPIHFEAAVKADKHVFMEKPVAVDAPGVRQVLAAAEEAKKKNLAVGVGLQRRHQDNYLEAMKRLQDGAIGDIHTARVYWMGKGVWVRKREPQQTEMEYQMRNWYYFNWLCGDHICEQHIHNLDVINWLKNGFPVRAQGMGGRQARTGKEYGEIYDHHFVEYEYADGSKMFSQCRHIEQCYNSIAEHVVGTKGYADISGGLISTGSLKTINAKTDAERTAAGDSVWRFPLAKGRKNKNAYQVEHDDLFAAIRAGTPYNEAAYGAMSTMTAILGRMCTYSGKLIQMEDALASKISLAPQEYSFAALPQSLPDAEGRYAIAIPGMTKTV